MVNVSPILVVFAVLGLAAARSLDSEAIQQEDQVLTFGNFSYTVFARSLAEVRQSKVVDKASLNENERIHPSVEEDARLLTVSV